MKKIIISTVVAASSLLFFAQPAFSWGSVGHKIVIAIAERHLTAKAQKNLAHYMPEGLVKDAVWADKHRHDDNYAFTTHYHTMMMTEDYVYAPALREPTGGDCITGLNVIDYNLTHREALAMTDSMIVFNIRMLIHIIGDMHCPAHVYLKAAPNNKWKCTYRGKEYPKYHSILDHLPDGIFEGQTCREAAGNLDKWNCKKIKEAQGGSFTDWAQDCCSRDRIVYDVNPVGTYDLDPDTEKKLEPACVEALTIAGYRLAAMLNKYFDY